MDEKVLIEVIAQAIQDKKGKGVVSLDLTGMDGAICSHFVVCNADSTTQVAAIADSVEEAVFQRLGEWPWRVEGIEEKVFEELREKVHRIEGMNNAVWVAVDYIDVVVHIFQTELRDYYKLEELWADAPMVEYNDEE